MLIRFRSHQFVYHCYTNLYTQICITLFFVTRFDDNSSDEDVTLSELAIGVGKSTGDSTDDDDKLYAEDYQDAASIGTKIR